MTRQIATLGPRLQPLRRRAAGRAGRAAAGPGRPAGPGLLRQLRRRGQRGGVQALPAAPAAPTSSPPIGGFHGRTMGALALTGQPAKADPFRPLPGEVTHVPYGDVAALGRGGHRRDRDGDPGADPGRERRRRAAGRLPRRGPARSPPGTARCSCSTRCRPASAAPGTGSPTRPRASSPTWSPWPRGSAAGCRSAPASPSAPPPTCSAPARTAPPSAATRSAAPPRSRCSPRSPAEGLLDHVKRIGERLRRGIEALGHPLVAEVRGAGLLLGIVLDRAGRRPRSPTRCARPASWPTPVQPDALRLAPPLILTAEQVDAFLAALPAALDAACRHLRTGAITAAADRLDGGCRMIRHFLRDDDLTPGRAGRGARPGRRDEGRPRTRTGRWPGRGRSRCSSTSRACAPGSRSRSASPSSAGTRSSWTARPPTSAGARPSPTRRGCCPATSSAIVHAHLRRRPDRRAGGRRRPYRWSTRSPTASTRASCWPTCSPSASTSAAPTGRTLALRRRRGEQHGPLVPARPARPPACTYGSPVRPATSPTRRSSAEAAAIAARTGGSVLVTDATRSRRSPAPTSSPPTPGPRWGRRTTGSDRITPFLPYQVNAALLGAGRAGRDRAALPAGAPRRGDHRRGDGRAGQRGLRPGGEPAARAEGAAGLAAGRSVAARSRRRESRARDGPARLEGRPARPDRRADPRPGPSARRASWPSCSPADGVQVTQATLSRDLEELGAVKVRGRDGSAPST